MMKQWFFQKRVPEDRKIEFAWDAISQTRRDMVNIYYGNEDQDVVHETNVDTFFEKLRKIFHTDLSVRTHKNHLKKKGQKEDESIDSYILRYSKDILEVLPFSVFNEQEHCYLIAKGIRDPDIREAMSIHANKVNVKLHSFRQKASACHDAKEDRRKCDKAKDLESKAKEASRVNRSFVKRANDPISYDTSSSNSTARRPRSYGNLICYYCKEKGHIKPQCPIFKKWLADNKSPEEAATFIEEAYFELVEDLNDIGSGKTSTEPQQTEVKMFATRAENLSGHEDTRQQTSYRRK